MATIPPADKPDDPSVDYLILPDHLRRKLKAAGLDTIGKVEKAFATNTGGSRMQKIPGIAESNSEAVRNALHVFRNNALPKSEVSPQKPPTEKNSEPEKTKAPWTSNLPIFVVLLLIVVAFVLGVPLFFRHGDSLTEEEFFLCILTASFLTTCFLFLAAKSSAILEGTIAGTSVAFKVTGAAAFFVLSTWIFWMIAPRPASRTVEVFLVTEPQPNVQTEPFRGAFTLVFRCPREGQRSKDGTNGNTTLRGLAKGATELEVDRLECYGYTTVEFRDRLPAPWKYPIVDGVVNIKLVPIAMPEDPRPKWKDVLSRLDGQRIPAEKASNRGAFAKRQVALSIRNDSDLPISFLAYDCEAALRQDKSKTLGQVWPRFREEKDIQPGSTETWGTFEEFEDPSGWFALYVRFEDRDKGRMTQQELGCYQLFNIRQPRVVVERSGEPGVKFRISMKQSLLGKVES